MAIITNNSGATVYIIGGQASGYNVKWTATVAAGATFDTDNLDSSYNSKIAASTSLPTGVSSFSPSSVGGTSSGWSSGNNTYPGTGYWTRVSGLSNINVTALPQSDYTAPSTVSNTPGFNATNTAITGTMSEGVYKNSNGTGAITADMFSLTATDASYSSLSGLSISSVTHTAGSTSLVFSIGFGGDRASVDDLLSTDKFAIALNSATIYDQYGNGLTYLSNFDNLNPHSLVTSLSSIVSGSVGSGGGTVKAGGTENAAEAKINIPANALDSSETIKIDLSLASNPMSNGVARALGSQAAKYSRVISLEPHGQTFDSPVTLEFSLTGSVSSSAPSDLKIFKSNAATGTWYELPAQYWSILTGTVTLSTTTFSRYQAIGGNSKMGITTIKGRQLAKLTENNKALAKAIDITGSSAAAGAIHKDYAFIAQADGSDAVAVSASVMADFFSSLDVTGASDNRNYRIAFVNPEDNSDVKIAVDNDSGLMFNPSTDKLSVDGIISGSGALQGASVSCDGALVGGSVSGSGEFHAGAAL